MPMQPERPERAAADDRAEVEPSDVGSNPMHPHPQDRPVGDAADHGRDDSDDDDPDDDNPDDSDDSGKTDDESPVDRYSDSPGAAATRPMSAPGEVAEPNEPA